jgi:hypothetical protein
MGKELELEHHLFCGYMYICVYMYLLLNMLLVTVVYITRYTKGCASAASASMCAEMEWSKCEGVDFIYRLHDRDFLLIYMEL